MITTEMSKEQAKSYTEPVAGDAPRYSYGTCVSLDTELLKRLGFETLPPVGAELTLRAKVTVVGTSSREEQDGDKYQSCDLQITEMELAAPAGKGSAEVLYGS